ncbi:toprim domain-containing protein [Paenochrobactrum sp. BZR 588]|uniref:DUF7146 domain-containing protein n=1 Tax=unclassified Paenochrobactrum TaxID=2639760 RepID=UPI0038538DAB
MYDTKTAAQALRGDVHSRNRILCPGPGHSRHDRSLLVTFTNDGFVVHSFAGDDFRECRDHVKAVLGLSNEKTLVFHENAQALDVERLRRQRDALSIWQRSTPIVSTLAETYLINRNLSYGGDALRFWQGGRAMVGLITDVLTNEPIGIHRTYLNADGSKSAKKMLGTAKGGVVRLSGDDEVTAGLSIAEGIESALGAMKFGAAPIWACLSAGNIASFPVLDGIEALTIYADNDQSGTGQSAAYRCAERWHKSGREVTVTKSKTVGEDIADIAERVA